jgi:transglutaminase-like putative cysteine protease
VILEVSHRTIYRYGATVSVSHHLLHLEPRATAWQRGRDTALEVDPAPAVRAEDRDSFGNPTTFLTIQQPHDRLRLHSLFAVELAPRPAPAAAATPPWEEVRDALAAARTPEALDALQFRFASTQVPMLDELRAFATRFFSPGRPILAASVELMAAIHAEFRYAPGSTTAATPLAGAFAARGGVCQDFAHIAIGAVRAMGLAARYVSGYLLTRPPEGRPKLVGADASHAWLAVWVPGSGWIDLDPTNDLVVDQEHVTLAWGRDYADVSPVAGVIFGGGSHEVEVAVDVVPIG